MTKANLMAASGILVGLRLEDRVIYRTLRRDIMQDIDCLPFNPERSSRGKRSDDRAQSSARRGID